MDHQSKHQRILYLTTQIIWLVSNSLIFIASIEDLFLNPVVLELDLRS